jgi:glutamate:GABA antiporter
MQNSNNKKKGTFGLPLLIIINVIIVVNLSQLIPAAVTIGFSYLLFYMLGAILFFIPVSLAVAELSSISPEQGGMYNWVKMAFGRNMGLVAGVLQWLAASLFTIVFLTFALVSLAFTIMPTSEEALNLASNQYYIIPFILVIYWSMTYLNTKGIKIVKILSIFGIITSILIPIILLIFLTVLYITSGFAAELNLSVNFFSQPMDNLVNLKIGISTFAFFLGIDLASNFSRNVDNPQKNYFYGTLLSAGFIVLLFFILCTFYIVVAKDAETNIIFIEVNRVLNLLINSSVCSKLLGKLFSFSLFVGSISYVFIYISLCCKGALFAIEDADNELWLDKKNEHDIPVRALVLQAVLVSFFCLAFVLQSNTELVCSMLGGFTISLVLVMYIIMFIGLIKIRFLTSDYLKRPYKLPFGKYGVLLISIVGILSSIFAIIVGLYLSLRMSWEHYFVYIVFCSIVLLCFILFFVVKFSKTIRSLIFEKSDHSNNKGRKITFTLVVLGGVAYFFKYFLNIILTRNLNPDEYGDLAVFLRTVIILSLILLVGTNNSTKKYLSKYFVKKDKYNIKNFIAWNARIISKSLVIYILSLFILYLIMMILHLFEIKNFFSYHYVFYYLAVAPLAAIAVLLSSYILSNKWPILFFFFRKIAVFVVMLILIGGGLLFYNIKISLYSIGIFLLISYVIVIFAELVFISKLSNEHKLDDVVIDFRKTAKKADGEKQWLSDSFRMIGSQLIFNLIWTIDLFILEWIHYSEHDVGYYAAMLVLTNILLITPSAITTLLIPRITHFVGEKKFTELQSNINVINFTNIAILTIILIILLTFSKTLLLFFGEGYSSAEIPFIILCFTYYIASIFVPAGKILTFVETDLQLKINLIELVIVVVLGVLLTWFWGLTGIAVSVLISIIFKSLLTYIILKRKLPINPLSLF